MLAVSAMSPTLAFLFVLAAIICWVAASLGAGFRLALIPLGLALFAVPVAWAYLVLA